MAWAQECSDLPALGSHSRGGHGGKVGNLP